MDGNLAQSRVIAKQLFDVWKAEQETAAARNSQNSRFVASFPAWMACALSLSTLIYVAGGMGATVNNNTRRIDALEMNDREQDRNYAAIMAKLGNIEGKLDGKERDR